MMSAESCEGSEVPPGVQYANMLILMFVYSHNLLRLDKVSLTFEA